MPNALVVGSTKSGKTTLCYSIARQLRSSGKKVALCCSICAEKPAFRSKWPHDIFVPPELLNRYVMQGPPSFMFWDEASDYLSLACPENQQLVKKSANYKKFVYVIAQRAKQIPPNTRTQCTTLICFHQSAPNAKIIVDEFDRGLAVDQITTLRAGEYWYSKDAFHPAVKLRAF